MFPGNFRYVAAWDHEVRRQQGNIGAHAGEPDGTDLRATA